MRISFISRPEWLQPGKNGRVFPMRLTSRVRGKEIASYLGAEYSENGKSKFDMRIYLKPKALDQVKDGDYLDILDKIDLIPALKTRPKIKVIVMSKVQYDYFKKELKNEFFLIPHHHINFENKIRVKSKSAAKPLVGGIIGKPTRVAYDLYDEIKSRLSRSGIDFRECFHYKTRQDILDFHDQLDFQVIWFPGEPAEYDRFYRHATKIANAASFGIPTIAQDILGHQEFAGDYLVAGSYDDIAKEAERLRDETFYNELSERLIEKAKQYHISKIADLYRELK